MQDTSAFTRVLMQDTSVFTRVLMQMVRTPVIETRSSEWHSDARPSSYARIGGEWTESNLLPEGTAFTAQRRHQPAIELSAWVNGLRSRLRSCGLLLPKQALCQTELCAVGAL